MQYVWSAGNTTLQRKWMNYFPLCVLFQIVMESSLTNTRMAKGTRSENCTRSTLKHPHILWSTLMSPCQLQFDVIRGRLSFFIFLWLSPSWVPPVLFAYLFTYWCLLSISHLLLHAMIHPDVSHNAPAHEQPTIGLIGMGTMGRMYAKLLSQACWKQCGFSPPLPSYPLTISTASTSATSPRNLMPLSVISSVRPHAHLIVSSLSPHDLPCPCTLHPQTYPTSPCFQTAMQSPALLISSSTLSKQSLLITSWCSTTHVCVSSPSFITLQTALTLPANYPQSSWAKLP